VRGGREFVRLTGVGRLARKPSFMGCGTYAGLPRGEHMRVSLIGGMDRLHRHYLDEAAKLGVDLRIFTRSENNLQAKIGHTQAVVIFTSKISHQARNQAMSSASTKDIPVFMSHNCGVCALRDCINCIKGQLKY